MIYLSSAAAAVLSSSVLSSRLNDSLVTVQWTSCCYTVCSWSWLQKRLKSVIETQRFPSETWAPLHITYAARSLQGWCCWIRFARTADANLIETKSSLGCRCLLGANWALIIDDFFERCRGWRGVRVVSQWLMASVLQPTWTRPNCPRSLTVSVSLLSFFLCLICIALPALLLLLLLQLMMMMMHHNSSLSFSNSITQFISCG